MRTPKEKSSFLSWPVRPRALFPVESYPVKTGPLLGPLVHDRAEKRVQPY